MESSPIDPIHIGAIPTEGLRHNLGKRATTAPSCLPTQLSTTSDVSSAPAGQKSLARTAPMTPLLPKMQHNWRWRRLRKPPSIQDLEQASDWQQASTATSQFSGRGGRQLLDPLEW